MACNGNGITEKYHDNNHVGQCQSCGGDIDEYRDSVEMDHCEYSSQHCTACDYGPCDEGC